jgi:hypothetical protein
MHLLIYELIARILFQHIFNRLRLIFNYKLSNIW